MCTFLIIHLQRVSSADALARIRDKAAPLSDEELDALAAEAQAAVRHHFSAHDGPVICRYNGNQVRRKKARS
ncbi:MAG TPA: hypothetical protein ENJ31_12480 [Anaerolineae bacterium]|nr:hypothetical protein [Anaerolineae bacterium]